MKTLQEYKAELLADGIIDANEVKERIESYFEDEGGELIHKETKGLELKE